MSTVFIPKHRKSLYTRVTIPTVLRSYFMGRVEVWKSLKTTDRDEACCLSAQWEARAKRLFLTLKQQGHSMTKAEIELLVSGWVEAELDAEEEYITEHGILSDEERDNISMIYTDLMQEANEAFVSNDVKKIAPEADELLKTTGRRPLSHTSVEFWRLCRRLLQAKLETLRIKERMWYGSDVDQFPILPFSSSPSPHLISKNAEAETKPTSPLFSEVMGKYLDETPRAARSKNPLRAELMRFMESIGGDRPVDAITKPDVRTYKDGLLLTRKLSPLTCHKHLSGLTTLFKWAEAQGYVPDRFDPVRGLTPSKRQAKKQAQKRRAFTDQELITLFGSQEFSQQKKERPERYWVVLLCLFTACRREEAAQLNMVDMGDLDSRLPYIRITDAGEDQTLKTESSRRVIPIHSSLIALGFLDYVRGIRESGLERVFPQLTKKGGNGYGDPVGKWFGRTLRALQLTDPALVFHSFRHTGITRRHAAGVSGEVVRTLTGHAEGDVHGQVYMHRDQFPLKVLREGLERLKYPEVMRVLKHRHQ